MNNNPLRLIATCDVNTSEGLKKASMGIDIDCHMSAADIHEAVVEEVYNQLSGKCYTIETVMLTSLVSLGQAPSADPITVVNPPKERLMPHERRYVSPDTCLACGDPVGHGGLQCPRMTPYS